MFLSDLRDSERKAFPEMQMAMQMFSHFAPNLVSGARYPEGPTYRRGGTSFQAAELYC